MTVLTRHPDRHTEPGAEPGAEPAPRPGVVERMTQILDVFLDDDGYQRLEDVTAATGLPRSTTFRLLSQLVDLQWLDHSGHGYRLGGRVLGMTARTRDHRDLRSAAADVLNELHLRTGGVAHLGVLDGAAVTYLDKVGGRASTSLPSRVGGQLPAHRTVLGRTLLACLPAERVDALLTGHTSGQARSVDLPRLHAELQRIRQHHGLALRESRRPGSEMGAVAAPVLGPDGAVGAIALAGRGTLRLEAVAPLVAVAARRTSQLLFPRWVQQQGSSARAQRELSRPA